jgi:DNA-binding transcriptional LysR family regulator
VSRTISKLEQDTGTKLLIRTTRSLTPTPAGLAFFESASAAVQTLEDSIRSLRGQDSIVAGSLKITAPEDLGAHVISPLIAKLSRQYPELSFEVNYTDEVLDLVRDGYDLAIRLGKLAPSRFKVKKLGEVILIPVASPKYLEGRKKIRMPEDLTEHDCLVYRPESSRPKWTLRSGNERANIAIRPKVAANMMSSLLGMAKQGAGIAFIPKYLCQKEIQSGELVRVLPDWAEPEMPVHCVSPLGMSASIRLKAIASEIMSGIEKALR